MTSTDAYNAALVRVSQLQNSGNACVFCGGWGFKVLELDTQSSARCEPCKGTGQAVRPPCPVCMLPDGSPNAAYLQPLGCCTLCSKSGIPWGEGGAGFCASCGDHSANHAECETCGREYEDWNQGKWEPVA